MNLKREIEKVLKVGDRIYIRSSSGVHEECVTGFSESGVFTERGYFPYSSFREVWFLTKLIATATRMTEQ